MNRRAVRRGRRILVALKLSGAADSAAQAAKVPKSGAREAPLLVQSLLRFGWRARCPRRRSLLAPPLAAIGAIYALAKECTIKVERVEAAEKSAESGKDAER